MYRVVTINEGTHQIWGPGINSYAPYQSLYNCTKSHAEEVARWLSRAHEAGREHKASEVRQVLGVFPRCR